MDAVLSPVRPPAPVPGPETGSYYKELSWQTILFYYLLGFIFYAFVMLSALVQDGTVQRLWFRWRWSLWQKHSKAVLPGGKAEGWFARWALRLYDTEKVRLDTFYQWLAEANEAFEEGRLEEAVEAYSRAVDLRPDSPVARVNLGAALGRLGRHEALEQFQRMLASDGANGDARKNAALALLKLGRPAEAYDLLGPHLEVHKRDSEAWWLAALCKAADPDSGPEEVSEPLRRACSMEPALRANISSEEAFSPYLSDPSFRGLVVPGSQNF